MENDFGNILLPPIADLLYTEPDRRPLLTQSICDRSSELMAARQSGLDSFSLFSSSGDKIPLGFGYLDSSEKPLLLPLPACVEVFPSEVFYFKCRHWFTSIFLLFMLYISHLGFLGTSFRLGFLICQLHSGACGFEWTYIAQGNPLLFLNYDCKLKKQGWGNGKKLNRASNCYVLSFKMFQCSSIFLSTKHRKYRNGGIELC